MLSAGQRLGRYEISSFIAAGGMGEVYRARDSVLDRMVALKILSPQMSDPDRIRRFILEAKAASALNHPHIVAIYDAGEAITEDGQHIHFIASEFIDGETLRSKITERSDLARIAGHLAQVADALAKAHRAGIIHRDIKPENIMITREGYAKVLDFGLAKLRPFREANASEVDTLTAPVATSPGSFVGTVGYMSPEQIEGREIDHRSDIFSLGCVAYELVTAKAPFRGNSAIDTMHRVLYSDPQPISELRPDAPVELQRIVRKCLAKAPDERYQSMNELAIDLRQLPRDLASESSHPTQIMPLSGRHRRRRWVVAAIAAAALVITAIALNFLWARRVPAAAPARIPFQTASIEQVTVSGDLQSWNVGITSDGKFIAYVRRTVKGTGIVVQQVGTGSGVEVVHLADDTFLRGLTINPVQQEIYYTVQRRQETVSSLFRVPLFGGLPSEVMRDVDSCVTFDPQGRRFAFLRNDQKHHHVAVVIRGSDGAERLLTQASSEVRWWSDPAWSPDGKTIACVNIASAGKVTLINAIDGSVREMQIKLPKRRSLMGAAIPHFNLAWFPDGKGLAAIWSGGVNDQIFYVSYPDGTGSTITNDDRYYFGIAIARDTSRIASTAYSTAQQVWMLKQGGQPLQVTNWPVNYGASGIALKPDGKIVYVSNWDLWQFDPSNGVETQMTRNSHLWAPKVSRDGSAIVFATASHTQEIWRIEPDGAHPRKIGTGNFPSLSSDGRQVIYVCCSMQTHVWTASADGASPRQILDVDCTYPTISPDGKRFAAGDRHAQPAVWSVFDFTTGRMLARLPSINAWQLAQWTPDGRALISVRGEHGVDNLFSYAIDGSKPHRLTNFTTESIGRFDVAADGTIAVLRGRTILDAVVVTDESAHR
jgi:serine/threonine protein kinase/Tol biopolymer transport system component